MEKPNSHERKNIDFFGYPGKIGIFSSNPTN